MGALGDAVGPSHAIDDPDVTRKYCTDWTGRFRAAPTTVVRPATTSEVTEIVTICRAAGVAIVPQGGNTGLVGGSVPLDGELVLSLERMAAVEEVNDLAGHVTVGAGASLAAVQRAATDRAWAYGVDIASRDTATIGGTIATNAGGLRVVRYGDTRQQLTGVEMVTGTGALISELSGVLRNNTGYNLPALVCGSEGTLGVITRARLRLVPAFPHRSTALIRFARPSDAAVAAESLRRYIANAESVELFFDNGMQLVCNAFGLQPPFADTSGGYVLVEAADVEDPTQQLAAAVELLDGVSDVAVANDTARRGALWQYRERHTDAIATLGIPHKLDVAVPPGAMATFLDALPDVVGRTAPDARVFNFGHAGEAAVHVNIVGPDPDDYSVDEAVLRLVVELGGSISAEHGIGRAKLAWVGLAYSAAELQLRRELKAVFDPDGIMNPGVLLTPG